MRYRARHDAVRRMTPAKRLDGPSPKGRPKPKGINPYDPVRNGERRPSKKSATMRRYDRYLRSPEWERMRSNYFKAHGRRCQACGATKSIHLHHKTYVRLGRERHTDFAAVCEDCHIAIHERAGLRPSNAKLKRVTENFIAQAQRQRSNQATT